MLIQNILVIIHIFSQTGNLVKNIVTITEFFSFSYSI